MISVMTLCCFKPSVMALLDGGGQVFVRDDFRGQFVPQHVDHIETGQQEARIAQRQAAGQRRAGYRKRPVRRKKAAIRTGL